MGKATSKLQPGVYTVFGATGAQGGSVVRALSSCAGEGVTIRAVTRDPSKDNAKELAKLPNVEVVKGDMEDNASIKKAVEGAYGVFLVTDFWSHMNVKKEIAQGKRVADAVKAAGVTHLVFSGLENVKALQNAGKVNSAIGKIKPLKDGGVVPHFEGKAEILEYIRSKEINTTNVMLSFYAENFIGFFPPSKNEDGTFNITFPMKDIKMGVISVSDLGGVVARIFAEGEKHYGADYGLASDMLTGDEIAAKISKASGKTVKYNGVDVDVFKGFGFPGCEDLGNMFHAYHDLDLIKRDPKLTKKMNPKVQSFDKWVKQNIDKIPGMKE